MQSRGRAARRYLQVSSGNIASDDPSYGADTSNRIFQNVYRFSMNMTTTATYVAERVEHRRDERLSPPATLAKR